MCEIAIAHARQRFICAPELDDLFVDGSARHALDYDARGRRLVSANASGERGERLRCT
jgi:hypothetical protein